MELLSLLEQAADFLDSADDSGVVSAPEGLSDVPVAEICLLSAHPHGDAAGGHKAGRAVLAAQHFHLEAVLLRHRFDRPDFINVGLDAADPLTGALRGLWVQTTDIWYCTASLAERPRDLDLGGLPVHHEIALV